jgi:hypothetical protein
VLVAENWPEVRVPTEKKNLIEAMIGNMTVMLYIDTAAYVSCISEEFMNRLPKECVKQGISTQGTRIIGVHGVSAVPKPRKAILEMKFTESVRCLEFFVLPNLKYDAILGLDHLSGNATIDLEKNVIQFFGELIPLKSANVRRKVRISEILSLENIELPPYHQMLMFEGRCGYLKYYHWKTLSYLLTTRC